MSPLRLRSWTNAQLDQFATSARTLAVGVFLALFKEFSAVALAFCAVVFVTFMAVSWYVAAFIEDKE